MPWLVVSPKGPWANPMNILPGWVVWNFRSILPTLNLKGKRGYRPLAAGAGTRRRCMDQLPTGKDPLDEVIEEFLEEHPRAHEWKEWRRVLSERLAGLREQRDALPAGADASELDGKIAEVEGYLAVLAEEAAITEFIESSIRATVTVSEHELAVEDDVDE
jgi:hypothetical protein